MQVIRSLAPKALLAALLTGYLEGLRFLLGAPFTLVGVTGRWAWLLAVLTVAMWGSTWSARGPSLYFPLRIWLLSVGWLISLIWYIPTQSTSSAWVVSGIFYALVLVWAEGIYTSTINSFRSRRFLWRGLGWGVLVLLGGLLPVALQQIESRFSEEEFFAILNVVALSFFTVLLLSGYCWLAKRRQRNKIDQEELSKGIYLNAWLVWSIWAVLLILGGWGVIYAYQHSFYSVQPPTFEEITTDSPFLCGVLTHVEQETLDGKAVFDRLLARVEANPRKTALEYGMLSLITGERRWAESFREAILEEAKENRYTGPANSVKFIQRQAALRVYYLIRVREAFPGLLSEDEWSLVQSWLRAINQRSLTVEWVDWMYGLAFSKWPEGPYENQEIGAGLLALLEVFGTGELDPDAEEMSKRNQDYLVRNWRGWFQRFRNTDDAYIYQSEWINNALFQALYWGDTDNESSITAQNRRLSFEWLLLQALPDGTSLGYNHPDRSPLAMVAYLGAELQRDPRYLWLSARSLEAVEASGRFLPAQPGIETPLDLPGAVPTVGSCLLFGDSGLPNQQGPLAPDKVVFRSGWLQDSKYLLLNLRFTGWHRYKSTNSIALLYQEGPLVIEASKDTPSSWLPIGRSQFRDKRIPRGNLNGLLIPRSGMSRVLYELIGVGGSLWAQDPPHYARVERFETLGPLDVSRTAIDDWRGWDHVRTIYFTHSGPIVVVDVADNKQGKLPSAITWHLSGQGVRDDSGLWLRQAPPRARLALPQDAWDTTELSHISSEEEIGFAPNWDLVYHSPKPGQLYLSTAFLMGTWANADYEAVTLRDESEDPVLGQYVRIAGASGEFELLHNEATASVEKGRLSTDGQSLIRLRIEGDEAEEICYVGGQSIQIQLPWSPIEVTDVAGHILARGEVWDWADGSLLIYNDAEDSQCVRVFPR
jgi:hypothetical protein